MEGRVLKGMAATRLWREGGCTGEAIVEALLVSSGCDAQALWSAPRQNLMMKLLVSMLPVPADAAELDLRLSPKQPDR